MQLLQRCLSIPDLQHCKEAKTMTVESGKCNCESMQWESQGLLGKIQVLVVKWCRSDVRPGVGGKTALCLSEGKRDLEMGDLVMG